ncbi:M28 family peptidase [Flavobacterium sp. Fl-77]|uniref:Vacuolar membrane protease n=1 Tax=Flavobacterium flavipigmentatum TaxID=2893884 RepID=A0AAJ2VVU6_9FLAO|nr:MULTISPECIES: M28 family peptidase [unclassified Flavobacterium]MDX6180867.1 M28 family peptidase [Flavobacterium sp. Fl-33]MDX6184468.1 M28 family peptidase [Flavobacterium sp. Fl-77]UFH39576.1 M28 family peptidase [Flavobacterium sp. F-70]
MKKNYNSITAFICILAILGVIYASMMPQFITKDEEALAEFSTERAFEQVRIIAQKPHYVGSTNHELVANYLKLELNRIGLETSTQEGFTLNDRGLLVKSKNILARIKGTNNSKALLLLSHYDSAPHSFSKGASDDASGVATILEGIRAFLYSKQPHKNDIIILFSDAEELGLNGAALFVNEHQWAKEVGLVLNFEARGSSGPSYMLMETNQGNQGLIQEFKKAKTTYPVSNSLMYSIYKMLPNDTDLTVFREQGNIQGFNFAFIDSHYNYHTQQDDIKHLSKTTLKHQGTYLMPLLKYFSNIDLNQTVTTEDNVYFNIPFSFVTYPFTWVFPMTLIALGLLILFIFIGKAKRVLTFSEMFRGFVPLIGSVIVAGFVTFLGWKIFLEIYPQYNDLLNGFTYNGHAYIGGFVALSLAICFAFYRNFSEAKVTMNHYVAPLLLWIIVNAFLANSLTGAGFLIIPVYFGLILFGIYVLTQGSSLGLNLIFSIPALIIIVPFIQMFPVGLGLKVLFGSAVLTVLAFGLLLPVFGSFARKGAWTLFFFTIAISCFVYAGYHSDYQYGKAKSNSLLYVYNADNDAAVWTTYDINLDDWTKTYLGQNSQKAVGLNKLPIYSKYNSGFTYSAIAPKVAVPKPTILFLRDSLVGSRRHMKIQIRPNRKVNRYDIFANLKMTFYNFKANGVKTYGEKGNVLKRDGMKMITYYVVKNEPLTLEFTINNSSIFDMDLIESSFDLMTNPLFKIAPRSDWMMPTPFVLNDAVLIQQKIKRQTLAPVKPIAVLPAKETVAPAKDSLTTSVKPE